MPNKLFEFLDINDLNLFKTKYDEKVAEDINTAKTEIAESSSGAYASKMTVEQVASTGVVTFKLYSTDNTLLDTKTLDLDTEHIITNVSLDYTNKKLIFTMKDTTTLECSISSIVTDINKRISYLEVNNIKGLTNAQCNSLRCGDIVAKVDSTGKHAYEVSYKKDNVGLCLTYKDATYTETVSYDYINDNWTFNSVDSLAFDTKADKSNTYTKIQVDTELLLKENKANKVTSWSENPSNEKYPAEKLVKDALDLINSKIPSQASSSNQLADKDYVNSSIATNTAHFIGTFENVTALENYSGTVTNNDYAFVINQVLPTDYASFSLLDAVDKTTLTNFDYGWVENGTKFDLYRFDIVEQEWSLKVQNTDKASVTLNNAYNRYKYIATTTSWDFEYTLNNSSFTAEQWASINSGMTVALKNQILANQQAIEGIKDGTTLDSFADVESALNTMDNEKQDVIDAQHKLDADLVDDTNSTHKFVTTSEKNLWNAKVKIIEVSDIKAISSAIIDTIRSGDIVVKNENGNKHTYVVSYKEDGVGICLTYTDAENVETVSYDYLNNEWVFNSVDYTTISDAESIQGKVPGSSAGNIPVIQQDGKLLSSIVPSDILEYNSLSDFPAVGENEKIYLALDTNFTYRWNGSGYDNIGGSNGGAIKINIPGYFEKIRWSWNIPSSFKSGVWSDGNNTYYSNGSTQKQYLAGQWVDKTWNYSGSGTINIYGNNVWKDNFGNIYATNITSNTATNYSLQLINGQWVDKEWDFNGMTLFYGSSVWTDGTNTYYSSGSTQKVLNGNTWEDKTWTGLSSITKMYIWKDGTNIYYDFNSTHKQLVNGEWVDSTFIHDPGTSWTGNNIWYAGEDIYYSTGGINLKFIKETKEFVSVVFDKYYYNELYSFSGSDICYIEGSPYYAYSDGTSSGIRTYKFIIPAYNDEMSLIGNTGNYYDALYLPKIGVKVKNVKNLSDSLVFEKNIPEIEDTYCIWYDNLGNMYYSKGNIHLYFIKGEWVPLSTSFSNINGEYIWTDGTNIYYSNGNYQFIFNDSISTIELKKWNIDNLDGSNIWTDGENIYYSNGAIHKQLVDGEWVDKTWNYSGTMGQTGFYGSGIWTDGTDIYNGAYFILNKSTSTWETIDTNYNIAGSKIWTDGTDIYYSYNGTNKVLNKVESTRTSKVWEDKTWNYTTIDGACIWTDGTNVYYSQNSGISAQKQLVDGEWVDKTWNNHTAYAGRNVWSDGTNVYEFSWNGLYILDKLTSTWIRITVNELINFDGNYVWTDGTNMYYSFGNNNYIITISSNSSIKNIEIIYKTWNGYTDIRGNCVWKDGDTIYYSYTSSQYVLNKSTSTWETKTWEVSNLVGNMIWNDGENIYYSNSNTQKQLVNGAWVDKSWAIPRTTYLRGSGIWKGYNNIYLSYGGAHYLLNKSTSTWNEISFKHARITSSNKPYEYNGILYTIVRWQLFRFEIDREEEVSKVAITGSFNDLEDIPADYGGVSVEPYWITKTNSSGTDDTSAPNAWGEDVWHYGDEVFCTDKNGSTYTYYKYNKSSKSFEVFTEFTGITNGFAGRNVWSDGTNTYVVDDNGGNKKLNSDYSWSTVSFTGLGGATLYPAYIWTDGINIYYSRSGSNYVLNISTRAWSSVTITGIEDFSGYYVWNFKGKTYYSAGGNNYIYNSDTHSWSVINMKYGGIYGNDIFIVGDTAYCTSSGSSLYLKFTEESGIWEPDYWAGYHKEVHAKDIWTDGTNTYYKSQSYNLELLIKSSKSVSLVGYTGEYRDLKNTPRAYLHKIRIYVINSTEDFEYEIYLNILNNENTAINNFYSLRIKVNNIVSYLNVNDVGASGLMYPLLEVTYENNKLNFSYYTDSNSSNEHFSIDGNESTLTITDTVVNFLY